MFTHCIKNIGSPDPFTKKGLVLDEAANFEDIRTKDVPRDMRPASQQKEGEVSQEGKDAKGADKAREDEGKEAGKISGKEKESGGEGKDNAAEKAEKVARNKEECKTIIRESKGKWTTLKEEIGDISEEMKSDRIGIDNNLMPLLGFGSTDEGKTWRINKTVCPTKEVYDSYQFYKKRFFETFPTRQAKYSDVTKFHKAFIVELEEWKKKRPEADKAAPSASPEKTPEIADTVRKGYVDSYKYTLDHQTPLTKVFITSSLILWDSELFKKEFDRGILEYQKTYGLSTPSITSEQWIRVFRKAGADLNIVAPGAQLSEPDTLTPVTPPQKGAEVSVASPSEPSKKTEAKEMSPEEKEAKYEKYFKDYKQLLSAFSEVDLENSEFFDNPNFKSAFSKCIPELERVSTLYEKDGKVFTMDTWFDVFKKTKLSEDELKNIIPPELLENEHWKDALAKLAAPVAGAEALKDKDKEKKTPENKKLLNDAKTLASDIRANNKDGNKLLADLDGKYKEQIDDTKGDLKYLRDNNYLPYRYETSGKYLERDYSWSAWSKKAYDEYVAIYNKAKGDAAEKAKNEDVKAAFAKLENMTKLHNEMLHMAINALNKRLEEKTEDLVFNYDLPKGANVFTLKYVPRTVWSDLLDVDTERLKNSMPENLRKPDELNAFFSEYFESAPQKTMEWADMIKEPPPKKGFVETLKVWKEPGDQLKDYFKDQNPDKVALKVNNAIRLRNAYVVYPKRKELQENYKKDFSQAIEDLDRAYPDFDPDTTNKDKFVAELLANSALG